MAKPILPPGPRWPRLAQTLAWWARPIPFFERCRSRFGSRFTLRLIVNVPVVNVTDPDEVREVFTAAPDVLHPGEGARVLEPVVGRNSVILLDEDAHMSQRKLLLPAFHGERMQALTALMERVTAEAIERWPRGATVELHPRVQALTLEIILRAVFGLEEGERLDRLREGLADILAFGSDPRASLPESAARLFPGTYGAFLARRERVDRELFELIDERRVTGDDGDDVLAMLLQARHEDGGPMSPQELRDELMTLLVAGHETTASALAWAFTALTRHPAVLDRLVAAVDADEEEYVTATVQETLRARPVLPNAAPRLVMRPVRIGPVEYEPGCAISPNAYLIHHDPAIYPEPYAFRPERFLEEGPGTYTWIPFGGGRRRCLGASFAQLEMRLVLRAVLQRFELRAAGTGAEAARRRSITLTPGQGARTALAERPTPARGRPSPSSPSAAVPA